MRSSALMLLYLVLLPVAAKAADPFIKVDNLGVCESILDSRPDVIVNQTLVFTKVLRGFPLGTPSLNERMKQFNLSKMNQSLPQFPRTPPSLGLPKGMASFEPFQSPVSIDSLSPEFKLLIEALVRASMNESHLFSREVGMVVVYTAEQTYLRLLSDDNQGSVSYFAIQTGLTEILAKVPRHQVKRISIFHTHPESTPALDQKLLSYGDLIFASEDLPRRLADDFHVRVPVDLFAVPVDDPATLSYTWVNGLR